jgi:hypothetical protein
MVILQLIRELKSLKFIRINEIKKAQDRFSSNETEQSIHTQTPLLN